MFREIVSSVGVVGNGVVGAATASAFAPYAGEVRVHDLDPARSKFPLREAMSCDVVFLCLPTPAVAIPQENGGGTTLDASAIDSVLRTLKSKEKHLLVRSTTPVGYCAAAAARYGLPNLVHCPEFLTARTAKKDAQHPRVNLVGRSYPGQDVSQVVRLFTERFPFVACKVMASGETEFAKLATNALFAAKVSAFNELHLAARELGLDWDAVLDGVLADGRVSHHHTQVPGPDGFGWGGFCLPKDSGAMASLVAAAQGGMAVGVLNASAKSNELHRLRSH